MKKQIFIISLIMGISISLFSQIEDDGYNEKTLETYENDVEVARVRITFMPGYTTEGHTNFVAYIDPNLPFNGGVPVEDGEFNKNYVRVYKPLKHNLTTVKPQHSTLDYEKWSETITYFDGLGREVQKIGVKGSPAQADNIKITTYDELGRKAEQYLPYAITQSGTNGAGGFRPDVQSEAACFTETFYPGEGLHGKSLKDYDDSPLNKTERQYQPGAAWNSSGSEKYIRYNYAVNSSGIPIFSVDNNGNLVKSGTYSSGELYKNTTTDEDGNQNIEYINKANRTIATVNASENLETYYVYDDLNNLRFVLPPLAADVLKSHATGSIGNITNNTTIAQYCFYYEYDKRKRMLIKKTPGVEPVYMAYNKRNQLILTQDGELRTTFDWLFTKYDVYNRPIITGIHNYGSEISAIGMQELANQSQYDIFESYTAGVGYSNNAYPKKSGDIQYTLTYYDDYDALSLEAVPSDYAFIPGELDFYYYEASSDIKGLATVTKTRVILGDGQSVSDEWLTAVSYYDKYNTEIQTISDNHLGGKNIASQKINFTGDIEKTKERHVIGNDDIVIQQKFEYDNAKRLLNAYLKVNDQAWKVINRNKHNEAGLLRRKQFHASTLEDSYSQTVNYLYNIRGWMTSMNSITNLDLDLFALQLDYTNATYPQYNGNIGAMSWSTKKMQNVKTYNFDYDGANRITQADYSGSGNYNTGYSYDKNGNINTLERYGQLGASASFGLIDQLSYSYTGNQLKKVDDLSGTNQQANGYSDNGIFTSVEYTYDQNGNMVKDLNKNIQEIKYNHLNLPVYLRLETSESNEIDYIFSANGQKLQKQTRVSDANVTKTDYVGNYIYENNVLKFIIHSEGRLVFNESSEFEFQYYLKDHLGNTRVMFDTNGDPLQDISYYPFGMSMGDAMSFEAGDEYPENKYLYNGKEFQDDFNLNWYDYGARFYDPALARWHTVDPHAVKYFSWSPYNYVYNNPINAIDPDGRDGVIITFPDYKISTPVGKVGGLGHAGVLLIDNKTGYTKYYEYGRYDKAGIGEVRNRSISNVTIGKDGMPTQKSLNKVMKQISDKAGHGGKIEGAYVKSDKFGEMNDYAKGKMKENSDPDRKEYNLMNNNCGTFAEDVVGQDKEATKDAPSTIDPRPNSMVKEYQDEYQGVHYDPKAGKTTIDPKKEEEK